MVSILSEALILQNVSIKFHIEKLPMNQYHHCPGTTKLEAKKQVKEAQIGLKKYVTWFSIL